MLKFAGAVLLVICGGFTGISMSNKVLSRERCLRAVNSMFDECAVMLNFNACTITELFEHLRQCSELDELKFLRISESDNCQKEAEMILSSQPYPFTDDEKMCLSTFFRELGSTDIDGQNALIERSRHYFKRRLEQQEAESLKKCKLYKTMGIMTGIFIAVVLI